MARGDLTDHEWAMISPLLLPERGRWAHPAGDNRLFLNGMLYVLRTDCPWRDMHERYGKWNSVYVRFRRWAEQGVRDTLLQTLADLGLTDNWQHMVDSTIVRGHSQATGAKRGLIRTVLVDHAAVLRAKSMPDATIRNALVALFLPEANSRITKATDALTKLPVPNPKAMQADRGYDSDSFRQELLIHEILLVIPSRKGRKAPQQTDWQRYRDRNRIERMFNRLKQMRRIATRYDKTALSFMSFLSLAAARLWIRSFVNVT